MQVNGKSTACGKGEQRKRGSAFSLSGIPNVVGSRGNEIFLRRLEI